MKNLRFTRGMTLIETVIAVSVFIVAIIALFSLFLSLYRSYGYNWEQINAIEEARKGIEMMMKNLREAKFGEDGSYPIIFAADKEIIFFSDIDNDGLTERVRYFLGTVNSGIITKECQTSLSGGSCSVTFSNFLTGTLTSAELKISVEGDFGNKNEYATIYADGSNLGKICDTGCNDCPGVWQGTRIFNVTNQAKDNYLSINLTATSQVGPECSSHSMRVRAEFSFTEDLGSLAHEFKRGIIRATGTPLSYPPENEIITLISPYIRNAPPIFEYFDKDGNKLVTMPSRLKDTKTMKVYLVVNIDPSRPPTEFELQSFVNLRNLKDQ